MPHATSQMSLYYDAATVLGSSEQEGSLKSRIYGNKSALKSKPAHQYALISETAKYDRFLKEVIDSAGFLSQEPKVGYDLPRLFASLLIDPGLRPVIVDTDSGPPPGS